VEEYEYLVNHNEEPERAILNLDWDTGTHWVGVISRNNVIYYYDPFGVGYNLKIKKPIIFNQIKDQELNESNCGWRSLYFVLKH
jgi:hypothetical protein